jgi:hypothetical protein
LITEKPIRGWGEDPAKIEAVLRDEPEVLAMYREEMHGPLAKHGTNQHKEETGGYGITSIEQRGTNSAYLQARIERDCPDELKAIKRGKKNGGKSYAQVAKEQGRPIFIIRWARSLRIS